MGCASRAPSRQSSCQSLLPESPVLAQGFLPGPRGPRSDPYREVAPSRGRRKRIGLFREGFRAELSLRFHAPKDEMRRKKDSLPPSRRPRLTRLRFAPPPLLPGCLAIHPTSPPPTSTNHPLPPPPLPSPSTPP